MKDAFLQAIRDEYPNEEVTRLVFADWCIENEPELEEKLRKHIPIIDEFNNKINIVYGSGHRYGYGDRYGDGGGDRYWYEYGYGYGHSEHVDVEEIGIPYRNSKLDMPKLHTNQLIFLSYNIAFCGYVQEHLEPYQFKITNASRIGHHDSSWHEIANNINRKIQIRKFGTITIGPQIFHSIDWVGNLP